MRVRLIWSLLCIAALSTTALAQISDSNLAEQVAGAVRRYANFTVFDDVTITVSHRTVTLSGAVTMPFKRDEIGARIGKIDGVKGVTNDIQVLPVDPQDVDLRQRIAHAIYNNASFWRYSSMACPPIHIIVAHGHVTLTGVVNSDAERLLANSLAQVSGTLSVKNELRLDKD
jgi:hypothetical protein